MKTQKNSYFAGSEIILPEINIGKDQCHCYFCSSDSHEHPSKICMPISICNECLSKFSLDLRVPLSDCLCGADQQLISLKFNGVNHAICENHMPTALLAKLAQEFTETYSYFNAPSTYGTMEKFQLIRELARHNHLESTDNVAENIAAFKEVLNRISQPQVSVISY